MAKFLIIQDNIIVNAVVADNIEILNELFPGSEILESISSEPWIGWIKEGDSWINPNI